MKKCIKVFLLSFLVIFNIDVYACGEIKNVVSNIGTVSQINNTNYLVIIPDDVDNVTLLATTNYKWIDGYGPRKVNTNEEVQLKVDGSSCGYGIYTYFINFKKISSLIAENSDANDTKVNSQKKDDKNSEETNEKPLLKLLRVDGYEIDFDPKKYEYDIEVGEDVKELTIVHSSNDYNTSVKISENYQKLVDGLNVITITLTNNGATTVYKLNVTKSKPKSNNNFLASIFISNHQINFDPSTLLYDVEINNEKALNFTVVTESDLATYDIIGNSDLKNGSIIKIKVTAEDGSIREYTINIIKKFNIMNYWIYIVIILLLLVILILLISRKKKKNKSLGPQIIAGQSNTKGTIQPAVPQNSATVPPKENNTTEQLTSKAPTTSVLKILEPTNIEEPKNSVDEENNPTEIFKL